jgi:hypothetical protein
MILMRHYKIYQNSYVCTILGEDLMDSPDSPAAEGDSASGDPSLLDCDDSNMDIEQLRREGRSGYSTL